MRGVLDFPVILFSYSGLCIMITTLTCSLICGCCNNVIATGSYHNMPPCEDHLFCEDQHMSPLYMTWFGAVVVFLGCV